MESICHLIAYRSSVEAVTRCGERGKVQALSLTVWRADVTCAECLDTNTPFPPSKI